MLAVQTWPTDRPQPHPRNARTHPQQQIDQIAASIAEYGFVNPILADERGVVIAGHGRLTAAKQLALAEVPVIVLEGLSEAQVAALRIADNRIAQNAGWNDELLRIELGNLKAMDYDLGKLGFAVPELRALLEPEAVAAEGLAGANRTLAERFGAPPFSVLDARQGWWQERKRAWVALGIKSELGRGEVQGSMASARAAQLAAPGRSPLPSASYSSDHARGDGRGRAAPKANAVNADYGHFRDGTGESWVTSSIFDPVLCELVYRWFSPPGGLVLDPFAGGWVRGIVAARLGRRYRGIDLRPEQVAANRLQAEAILKSDGNYAKVMSDPFAATTDDHNALTPIQEHGGFMVKRDDLLEIGGVRGGKVRTCWLLAQGANGLVTAGSRSSPQVNIVAHIANRLGIPARTHCPKGELSPEVAAAAAIGAEVVQHNAGYNSVIVKRARQDAERSGYREIPFGMECPDAVRCTMAQAENVNAAWDAGRFKRLVVPVGSGMSLAGVLHGLARSVPVLGVVVGADPAKRLDKYAPTDWRERVELIPAGIDYHDAVTRTKLGELELDPIYEAKCLPFLETGDMLWVVGIRETAVPLQPAFTPSVKTADLPQWVEGDSTVELAAAPGADLVFTCPPYADLEVYSEDPRDLSTMDYPAFLAAYRKIVKDACAKLRGDRFAVIVIGEVRDPAGNYRGLVPETIQAFLDAGLAFYNEAILVTAVGSLPVRTARAFTATRKLGKTHQNVLVFVKGDPRKAAGACGSADCLVPEVTETEHP